MGAENLNCNMSPNNFATVPDGTFPMPPIEEWEDRLKTPTPEELLREPL